MDVELQEKIELELDRLINDYHRQGIKYWDILRILLDKCPILLMQAEGEYWLNITKR